MRLTTQEAANSGFTDVLHIPYNHASLVASTTDDAAVTITFPMPVGSTLLQATGHCKKAFNDSGGGDELDFILGITGGDLDGILSLAQIHADGTEITTVNSSGALIDNENGATFATAGSLTLTLTPNASTGQSYALNELTQGELNIYMRISRIPE